MELVADVLKTENPSRVTYVRNERMAGFVPVWNASNVEKSPDFDAVLSAYHPKKDHADIESFVKAPVLKEQEESRFGFADLIDIVNPLQHVPLLNLAYRKLTGDEIKPISAIVGGGVYGGPAGVAGGLVDMIAQEEDVLGYASVFAQDDEIEEHKGQASPEFTEVAAYHDLPAHLLSLSEIPMPVVA